MGEHPGMRLVTDPKDSPNWSGQYIFVLHQLQSLNIIAGLHQLPSTGGRSAAPIPMQVRVPEAAPNSAKTRRKNETRAVFIAAIEDDTLYNGVYTMLVVLLLRKGAKIKHRYAALRRVRPGNRTQPPLLL
ncbi:hypothetical protein J7T55_005434 [Diaporthe amygdali]|uniref:uncharacterized protein n=1 Tax=Phomopsis amygdali TaxID=1214568 RepID=UPI0022FE825F|nr:uncharacterized protein J7T55_005434 [Diaporthe amygdali]KAJ0108891.1 hypothetical protein J7T55_005434 [Diaporthe amygdali]